jgi:hypothetical protein
VSHTYKIPSKYFESGSPVAARSFGCGTRFAAYGAMEVPS